MLHNILQYSVLLLASNSLAYTTTRAPSTTPVSTSSYGHATYSYNLTSLNFTTSSTTTTTTTTPSALKTQSISPAESNIIFPHGSYHKNPIQPWQVPWGHPLPQSSTNGNSKWGTLPGPKFPPFVGAPGWSASNGFGSPQGAGGYGAGGYPGTSRPGQAPWGGRTAGGTNPYKNAPNTGVVRSYDFTISRGVYAPDGVEVNVMLVNGQYPGPAIEANWGDIVQVTVHNAIEGPQEGTSLHWHGLLQKGTPYEDGVPGITQSPIAPGESFTYEFNADLYGTTWYHSHFSAQYSSGVVGPFIIHGPSNADYDIDLGAVMLSDWYHDEYYNILENVMGTDLSKVAPFSDNNLINGKGAFNCNTTSLPCTPGAGYSSFQFTKGKTHRLRLINTGAEGLQHFSIDQHTMTVIAYDFVPIKPYQANMVVLGIGQRVDVLVTASGPANTAVWMRSTISSCSLATQPNAFATIYYDHASTAIKPNSTAWPDTLDPCANADLSTTTPFFPITPSTPSTTAEIDINFGVNSTGHLVWTMNNSTFRTDYNCPILPQVVAGNTTCPDEWNVYNFGTNSSIRIVLNNLTPVGHPMHLHGHNMYVLAEGLGSWDGSVINGGNPMRRDVQMIRPNTNGQNGYLVLQIDADNDGVWPLHCHIAWHVSGGLYVNLLENPVGLAGMTIPQNVLDLSRTWGVFTSEGPVDQIDSGL